MISLDLLSILAPVWATGSGSIWRDMFVVDVSLVEKVLRPVIVYVALVLGLRVFGKRELAQLNPFDLVVLLSLANTVQNATIGDDNSLLGGLVGALALLSVNYIVVRFLFGHRRLDQIIAGKPTVLIENGRANGQAMARELITKSELLSAIHRQGFTRIEEIERCVLEPGGAVTITAKEPLRAERNHAELIHRLDELSRQIIELRDRLDDSDGRGVPSGGSIV